MVYSFSIYYFASANLRLSIHSTHPTPTFSLFSPLSSKAHQWAMEKGGDDCRAELRCSWLDLENAIISVNSGNMMTLRFQKFLDILTTPGVWCTVWGCHWFELNWIPRLVLVNLICWEPERSLSMGFSRQEYRHGLTCPYQTWLRWFNTHTQRELAQWGGIWLVQDSSLSILVAEPGPHGWPLTLIWEKQRCCSAGLG